MQLTRFTDYSLRVLIYTGLHPDEWVTIRQISEAYDISRNHLMKVVSALSSNQYLVSQRGPGGGIRLQRPPHEINLAEVILSAEGDMNLLASFEAGIDAPLNAQSNLTRVVSLALQSFVDTLGAHTLQDILEPREELLELFGARPRAA